MSTSTKTISIVVLAAACLVIGGLLGGYYERSRTSSRPSASASSSAKTSSASPTATDEQASRGPTFFQQLMGWNESSAAPTPAAAKPLAEAGVVNVKCPITGNTIDPAKVPANLTREFKGQKVGFCCGGCPPTWDKLTDAEKQAKLDKVLPEKK